MPLKVPSLDSNLPTYVRHGLPPGQPVGVSAGTKATSASLASGVSPFKNSSRRVASSTLVKMDVGDCVASGMSIYGPDASSHGKQPLAASTRRILRADLGTRFLAGHRARYAGHAARPVRDVCEVGGYEFVVGRDELEHGDGGDPQLLGELPNPHASQHRSAARSHHWLRAEGLPPLLHPGLMGSVLLSPALMSLVHWTAWNSHSILEASEDERGDVEL